MRRSFWHWGQICPRGPGAMKERPQRVQMTGQNEEIMRHLPERGWVPDRIEQGGQKTGLLPARMCFQTALSFRQRCERPVTIQLHVQQGGQLFSNLFPCALSSQSSSPGRAAQQPSPEKPNHRHPSRHRAVHLPQPPDIKKEPERSPALCIQALQRSYPCRARFRASL